MTSSALAAAVLLFLQPEATVGAEPSGGGGGGGGLGELVPGCGAGGLQALPLVLMIAVFYFLLLRPQQKREREREQMLAGLQKGQTVRTTGGIRGDIVEIDERTVTLLVAEKTRLNVLRANIAGPEAAPTATKEAGKA